jgi:hypothetical protein
MVENIYNYKGEDITNRSLQVISDDFGYIDSDNVPHINWGLETEECDCDGFDKRFRPDTQSETYIIPDYVIPKGTILCRYGSSFGRFTTLKGTDYNLLGLPYVKETIEYHEYIVSIDVHVECHVTKGIVAPKFNSVGGAIQFKHLQPILLECEDGILQEDVRWRQENI